MERGKTSEWTSEGKQEMSFMLKREYMNGNSDGKSDNCSQQIVCQAYGRKVSVRNCLTEAILNEKLKFQK